MSIVKDQQIQIGLNMLIRLGVAKREGSVIIWTEAGIKYMKSLPENPDTMSPRDYATKLANF